jgi:uncharacterized protein with HEPN domain
MLDSIGIIRLYTINITETKLQQDRRTFDAVLMNLVILGETATSISQQLQWTYPKVPWRQIIGFRNFVVHHYEEVEVSKTWEAISSLGELEKQLLQILKHFDS